MPKNRTPLPDPDPATTVGARIEIVRTGAGLTGVVLEYSLPIADDKAIRRTAQDMPAAERAALQTVHAWLVAQYRSENGYT